MAGSWHSDTIIRGMTRQSTDDLTDAACQSVPCHSEFLSRSHIMTDDDQLMLQIQSGDHRAFEELVDRFQGSLIGFFCRNTGDIQLAEDLTQETLLRVFNQSWDYLPRGRFRGWLFRIARNLMIDNARRASHDWLVKSLKGNPDDDRDLLANLAGEFLPPDERANHRELASLVDKLLAQIPEEQRLTFTLHHYSGLPLSEVAEAMETSLPTCKSRLRLAREKLREKLRQHGVSDPHDRS